MHFPAVRNQREKASLQIGKQSNMKYSERANKYLLQII